MEFLNNLILLGQKDITWPPKNNLAKLEELLNVPVGHFNELEIVTLYKKLNNGNQDKVLSYVKSLVEQQNVVPIKEACFAYKVYERLLTGIGATIYEDKDYDTVYFDKELVHDFASWIDGDSNLS